MTRINLIYPGYLHSKHLIAEYRELQRVFKLARPLKEPIPEYVMGKGHVKFFYDKLDYLMNRQRMIYAEMVYRGYKPHFKPHVMVLTRTWEPKSIEVGRNLIRLRDKLEKMAPCLWMSPWPNYFQHFIKEAENERENQKTT